MSQDTSLSQLVIHKLTQAQYETITTPNPNELYLVPDETSCPHIVETYDDAQTGSWYRIWSDGWCEQGGLKNTSGYSAVVTLLQPYRDNAYLGSACNVTTTYSDTYNVGFLALTTTTATIWTGTTNSSTCTWSAMGYIE